MYIERLTGVFQASLPIGIILDVKGVGYGIELPLSTLCQLPRVGETVSLWIFTYVREDAMRLFGFRSFEDRQAFEILLSLSGVGPKVALAILSTLTVGALERSVTQNEARILESVPGVGPRLAERIILELKPKMLKLRAAQMLDLKEEQDRLGPDGFEGVMVDPAKHHAQTQELLFADLISALENLGYKEKTVTPLINKLRKDNGSGAERSFQDLMRQALRQLSQGFLESEPSDKAPAATRKKKDLGINESELF